LLTLTELASGRGPEDPNLETQKHQVSLRSSLRRTAFLQFSQIFVLLNIVPSRAIQSPRNDLITEAACHLIAVSITAGEISNPSRSKVSQWRTIVDFGLKHRNPVVQEAAATAMAHVSKLVDCSAIVDR
jgi:tubulin-specific chaperone D